MIDQLGRQLAAPAVTDHDPVVSAERGMIVDERFGASSTR